MEMIIGQFNEPARAQEAIDALIQRKYDRADISFLANDGFGEVALSGAKDPSAVTAVLGLLVGLGTWSIPSLGPVLAAGPLAVGLAGMTVDAIHTDGAWLSKVLGEVHIPEPDTRAFTAAIRHGGALVLVRTSDALGDNIEAILRTRGAGTVERYLGDSHA